MRRRNEQIARWMRDVDGDDVVDVAAVEVVKRSLNVESPSVGLRKATNGLLSSSAYF